MNNAYIERCGGNSAHTHWNVRSPVYRRCMLPDIIKVISNVPPRSCNEFDSVSFSWGYLNG